MSNQKSLGNRRGRLSDADGSRRRLCMERLPHAAHQAVSLVHLAGHAHLHHLHLCLGVAAFFGGLWLNRTGPRVVALTGGFLYGLGVFLASFSAYKLWWLYLSYGVIGGIGLGFGYIVPIAVLVKWFPDRRGLITGIAVGGFGAGALVTAPVAHAPHPKRRRTAYLRLSRRCLSRRHHGDGLLHAESARRLEARKAGRRSAALNRHSAPPRITRSATRSQTWQWWALWLLLFLNTSAGISLISQESPIFQEIAKASAIVAAGMVGIVSIGNAVGRIFWAWISDAITRRWTFAVMFLVQVRPLLASAHARLRRRSSTVVSFIILMCYGGGFGTMPAFAADYFGSKNVGPIYGLMLTAWGAASAFGPLLIAHLRQATGNYTSGLHIIAGIMAVSILLPVLVSPPKPQQA